MYAVPFLVRIRNITRKLGINRIVSAVTSSREYEDKFGLSILNEIRPGDIVWDIGANVGLYTTKFKHKAAPNGLVVAFEPTESCFKELHDQFATDETIVLKNCAVGECDGEVEMTLEEDLLGANHKITMGTGNGSGQTPAVTLRAGDSIVEQEPHLFPNIVKIDVEGHEGNVIEGFVGGLADHRLRCVGIEIHFGLLAERGESDQPLRISKLLTDNGFSIRWTDSSHLLATR